MSLREKRELDALPGSDLIQAGVQDLREGRETIESLLVAIGAPRLRRIGIELPDLLPQVTSSRLQEFMGALGAAARVDGRIPARRH